MPAENTKHASAPNAPRLTEGPQGLPRKSGTIKTTRYARVSELPKEQPGFPYKPATMYRWHHVGKFPEIFLKFNGTLFVDLEALYRLIESGRTNRSGSR